MQASSLQAHVSTNRAENMPITSSTQTTPAAAPTMTETPTSEVNQPSTSSAPTLASPQSLALQALTGTVSPHPTQQSISRPLGIGVDSKIKGKIWAEEYIELGTLLQSNQEEHFKLVEKDGTVSLVKAKPNQAKFSSLSNWTVAFHIFVGIYCEKRPGAATALMKYANIISKLTEQASLTAALSYDRNFREWKALSPNDMPWDQINTELYQMALGSALQNKLSTVKSLDSSNFRGLPAKPYCYDYNNKGSCTKEGCKYAHTCQKCGGRHPRKSCIRNKQGGNKTAQPGKFGATTTPNKDAKKSQTTK
ncbi:hypothetical protein FSP39_001261 [Pinctada imbricata]|uniref:C3H1-type domain-containing protein n=1 Tax=Pinctada imbricata TaxID=66713 RepID=A0AA89C4Q8_PINIB|nr:hypothetical protein FSP39_001261 [Pinctada imbricata]